MPVHAAYGLLVRSARPLPGLGLAASDDHVDVDVHWERQHSVPMAPPDGEFLLQFATGDRLWYVATSRQRAKVLRFPGCCEFVVDDGSEDISAVVDPDVAPGLPQVLAAGALLAFVLAVRGATVLHASAVKVPDGVVGISAGVGRGKSTVAALACAGGLPLVTDDLLRLDLGPGRHPRAFAGARELRLRPTAAEVADRVAAAEVRRTADDRFALRPAPARPKRMPLAAIVVPRPRRDIDRTRVTRLDGVAAMTQLLAAPRLVGWRWPMVLRRQFHDIGTLVGQVPVVEMSIPWGPPFRPGLEHELAALLCGPEVAGSEAAAAGAQTWRSA